MRVAFLRSATACALLAVLACSVAGCGEEEIDASSEAAFEQSVERVIASLGTDAERERFQETIATLMASEVLFAPGDIQGVDDHLKKTFHGKSAAEIIAAGERAEAEAQAEMLELLEE